MSQTPNPHDPYGTEPGAPLSSQPADQAPSEAPAPAPQSEPASGDVPAPTSDPALHPHDPFAYDAGSPMPEPQHAPQAPHASGPADAAGQQPTQDPYAGPDAPQAAPGQGGYGPAGGYPGGPAGGGDMSTPPPGVKGVYEGALTGEPMQDSDARTWAMLSHLAALLQFVIPFLGGLIAQIVLFVVFKDRHRFLRYHAAEALNGAIAAVILSLLMGALFTIITIVTLGLGAFLFSLMFLPQLLQAIFAIIGAVKANQGIWWNYPINLRLIK